jgi:hypothetical protein
LHVFFVNIFHAIDSSLYFFFHLCCSNTSKQIRFDSIWQFF